MSVWLKYVRIAEVPAYEALGWVQVAMSHFVHHDHSSIIMEWGGRGEAPLPAKQEEAA